MLVTLAYKMSEEGISASPSQDCLLSSFNGGRSDAAASEQQVRTGRLLVCSRESVDAIMCHLHLIKQH